MHYTPDASERRILELLRLINRAEKEAGELGLDETSELLKLSVISAFSSLDETELFNSALKC